MEMNISFPRAQEWPVVVAQDVFGEKEPMCQIVCHEADPSAEPAVYVRYNDNGTVAEVLVRDDLFENVRGTSTRIVSDWLKRRDG